MKINGIDHISIAVRSLDEAMKIWEPVLGKDGPDDLYMHEAEKIRVARYLIGGIGFELMESTSPDGDVARFIEKRGEGIMLISLNVDKAGAAKTELTEKGYPTIDGAGKFRDSEFFFIHPGALSGVLLEMID